MVHCSLTGLTFKLSKLISSPCADSNLLVIFEGKPPYYWLKLLYVSLLMSIKNIFIFARRTIIRHNKQIARFHSFSFNPQFTFIHSFIHSLVINLFIHLFSSKNKPVLFHHKDKGRSHLESNVSTSCCGCNIADNK